MILFWFLKEGIVLIKIMRLIYAPRDPQYLPSRYLTLFQEDGFRGDTRSVFCLACLLEALSEAATRVIWDMDETSWNSLAYIICFQRTTQIWSTVHLVFGLHVPHGGTLEIPTCSLSVPPKCQFHTPTSCWTLPPGQQLLSPCGRCNLAHQLSA